MKTINPPVFVMKTSGFWSGLRDLNPRSLEPKSSAIPNFAKPGYSVEDFSDVVKHVVKSHFRPQFLKSQRRKVLEPQRFLGLAGFPGRSGRSAPKSSAIPNFAKPGYSVGSFSDVVKHVVKSHFRPRILKSQGRKVLEPQRFFGLRIFPGTSGRSAPKSSALPTDAAPGYGGYYI